MSLHNTDICEMIGKLDDNNMPLFVMDSISFARPPRVNTEDVSYIANASRLSETNAKLDMMNTLISENAARSLQNEERVQHLARNNAHPPQQPKYSSVASEIASRHHQATYDVTHKPGQSASSCKIGGITDSRNGQFRMPSPISNVTHLSMRQIPSRAHRQHGATAPAIPADVPASGSESTVMVKTVALKHVIANQMFLQLVNLRVVLKAILTMMHIAKERAPVVIVSSYNIGHIMVVHAQNS